MVLSLKVSHTILCTPHVDNDAICTLTWNYDNLARKTILYVLDISLQIYMNSTENGVLFLSLTVGNRMLQWIQMPWGLTPRGLCMPYKLSDGRTDGLGSDAYMFHWSAKCSSPCCGCSGTYSCRHYKSYFDLQVLSQSATQTRQMSLILWIDNPP